MARATLPTRLGRVYDIALVTARVAARTHGYALAVHGSELRDLDLIAVPWVDECSTPAVLAEAIRVAVRGEFNTKEKPRTKPVRRAHGRLGWAILLMGQSARDLTTRTSATKSNFHPYIDLSVIPPKRHRAAVVAQEAE